MVVEPMIDDVLEIEQNMNHATKIENPSQKGTIDPNNPPQKILRFKKNQKTAYFDVNKATYIWKEEGF